jgi:hypothetical protein
MAKRNTTVHASVIAKQLQHQVGTADLTKMFNAFRANNGTTPRDRTPVTQQTVVRYTNRGQGYTEAPPTLFRRFCLARIAKKF